MRITEVAYVLVIAFLLIGGCSEAKWSDAMTGSHIVSRPQPIPHSGPRVRVIVGRIENETGSGMEIARRGTTVQTGTPSPSATGLLESDLTITDPIGSGMRNQLITALIQTGVFEVVRTTESGGSTDPNTPEAPYLIEGGVTEYEPSQASIAGGYGWGIREPERVSTDPIVGVGKVISLIGSPSGVGGLFQQDHVAMSIHLTDLRTKAYIDSATVEAKPKDLGAALSLLFGGRSRMVDAGGQMQTPMQKAIRACMTKAAIWAANTVISRLEEDRQHPQHLSAEDIGLSQEQNVNAIAR